MKEKSSKLIHITCMLFLINLVIFSQNNGVNGQEIELRTRAKRSSTTNRNLICVPSLLTRGATSPRGDIKLQVGDTLEVNCTIDLNNTIAKDLSSKNIEFSFSKHEIPDELMKVSIVDESTAMLRVENMNVSTPYLSCSLRSPSNNKLTHICQNQIDVGYPPLEVLNFKCFARNWSSLNCTWNKPYNPVETHYELNYKLHRFYMVCGHESSYNGTDSCEWNGQTEPHYQHNPENIILVVNGTNAFKPEGTLWEYTIHHWSIIIPAKPEDLTVTALSSHEIEVSWGFSNFDLFKPGLQHRITACTAEYTQICFSANFSSDYKQKQLTQKIIVPYAFMKYRVEVQMKSAVSNNTENFWSVPAIAEIQTPGKEPDFPPLTTKGSFEVFNKYQIRDIFVYWQVIPPHHHNGSNFHFEFKVYENGQRRFDINPSDVKESFAIFSNLSMLDYKFEITSVNSKGKSPFVSTVYVPSSQEAPPTANSVTKLYYNKNGTYEISWRPPSAAAENITSYTVFKCNGSRELPNQCNILLDWREVDVSQNLLVYDDLPMHTIFKFGVSANTKNMSSGMILATCELIHDKVPGKITDVNVRPTSPSSILVKWNLDCTYKPGRIDGFRITYSLINSSGSSIDMDNNNKKEVKVGANDTSYELQDLQPFSKYMIAISIITRAGESQTSIPVFANTTETSPSDPPHVRAIDSTNTSGRIVIEAPANPNGVVQKYKIIYKPVNSHTGMSNQIEISTSDLILSSNQENYVNLTNLENNLNYSITVMACTVSCSNLSEPAFLMTKVGSTKLTKAPSVNYERETFIISWATPDHLGGPIDYFELIIKRNGHNMFPDEPRTVKYKSGQPIFEHEVHLQCESNTNVSVQVRAVSIVDGIYLFGEWSPEGSLSCSGIAAWILWLIGLGIVTIMIIVMAFLTKTVWKNVKFMKDVHVIFPPGMELNGVPHQKRRQHSGGDTHSFGKENLTYQLHLASQPEETKDFLPSDANFETQSQIGGCSIYVAQSQDSTFGERHIPLQQSIDEALAMSIGKIAEWNWQSNLNAMAMRDEQDRASSDFTRTNSLIVGILSTSPPNLSDNSTTIDDDYSEKRISPSPSNPLLTGRVHYENNDVVVDELSGIEDNDLEEHYKKVGFRKDDGSTCSAGRTPPNNRRTDDSPGRNRRTNRNESAIEPESVCISISPSTNDESQSQPVETNSQSPNNSTNINNVTPNSSSNPSLEQPPSLPPPTTEPAAVNNRGIVMPDIPLPSNNSGYIKWAYLKNNDPTSEDKSLTNAPYYQVGILLDSSS